MTEIMINGVDVSGCCLYKDGICLTDKGKCTSMCDYGAYAREEKLKRLEQENQELGKIINCKNGTIASLAEIRDELKEENTKLRKKLVEIKKIAKENNICEGFGCIIMYKILKVIEGAENEN